MKYRNCLFSVAAALIFILCVNAQGFDGDLNLDGRVNFADLGIFSEKWLDVDNSDSWPIYDLYDDGTINLLDFSYLANNWQNDCWWSNYSTAVFSPQGADVSYIQPTVNTAAGYFGGWYGRWYLDDQWAVGYAQNMWNTIGSNGVKRVFYYDLQQGKFPSFYYSNGDWYANKWTIGFKSTIPNGVTAQWFGLQEFFSNPQWSPFDTAEDYGIAPLLTPAGQVMPLDSIYEYLASRDVDDNARPGELYFNSSMTDQRAAETGLDQISYKTNGYWNSGTLWQTDEACVQFYEYAAEDAAYVIQNIPEPDGIHIDDWCIQNLWMPSTSAFGRFSKERFKDFMREEFTTPQLANMGINNIDTFDIAAYVRNKGWSYGDNNWSTDLIWSCYKIFKVECKIENANMMFKEIKKAARQVGRDEFVVYTNTLPLWPGAALLRGSLDVANFEWPVDGIYPGFSDPQLPHDGGRYGYVCRLAAQIGNADYSMPNFYVWPGNDGPDHEQLHKAVAFEGLANRGVPNYNLDFAGHVSLGTDDSAKFISDFITDYQDILSHRNYSADIGLVFCPWTDIAESTVQQMRFEVLIEEYSGWSDFLEDTHKQWDVILSMDLDYQNLQKYKIVIIPSISVIDDNQIAQLQQYVDNGGKLIVTGSSYAGERYGRDQYFVDRPSNAFDSFTGNPNFQSTSFQCGVFYQPNKSATWNSIMTDLLSDTGYVPTIVTGAPSTVGINANSKVVNGKTVLTVDLNNLDLDYTNDVMVPVEDVTFTLKLPDEFIGQTLDVSYVSAQVTNQPPIQLSPSKYSVSADTIEVTVPDFEYYSIIIVQY